MSIYVLEKRLSKKSLSFGYADESEHMGIAQGKEFDGVTLVAEYDLDECELLDYQGHATGPLCSERFVEAVRGANPEALRTTPAKVANHPEITEPLYLCRFNPKKLGRDAVDAEKTQVYTSGGELMMAVRIVLKKDVVADLDEKAQFFTVDGLDDPLFVTEPMARALDKANLTGLKLFRLDAWYEGIDSDDPYLTPSYHEGLSEQELARLASIIDNEGFPEERPEWDPENAETGWE